MLKILQARLHQYLNCEIPDVQAGFRKGRGTRDQIANIGWIIEKAREFKRNICFCFFDDPVDVGNLISGSSAFSKSSVNMVHTESTWFTLKVHGSRTVEVWLGEF